MFLYVFVQRLKTRKSSHHLSEQFICSHHTHIHLLTNHFSLHSASSVLFWFVCLFSGSYNSACVSACFMSQLFIFFPSLFHSLLTVISILKWSRETQDVSNWMEQGDLGLCQALPSVFLFSVFLHHSYCHGFKICLLCKCIKTLQCEYRQTIKVKPAPPFEISSSLSCSPSGPAHFSSLLLSFLISFCSLLFLMSCYGLSYSGAHCLNPLIMSHFNFPFILHSTGPVKQYFCQLTKSSRIAKYLVIRRVNE